MRGLSGSLIVLEKQGKMADNNWPKNTIIINNIKKSGPVLIKLIQWTLPKIEFMSSIINTFGNI